MKYDVVIRTTDGQKVSLKSVEVVPTRSDDMISFYANNHYFTFMLHSVKSCEHTVLKESS